MESEGVDRPDVVGVDSTLSVLLVIFDVRIP
jgi:hypothetical protein